MGDVRVAYSDLHLYFQAGKMLREEGWLLC